MATLDGQVRHDLATDRLWDMPEANDYWFLTPAELELVNKTADEDDVDLQSAYEVLLNDGLVSEKPLKDWE